VGGGGGGGGGTVHVNQHLTQGLEYSTVHTPGNGVSSYSSGA